MARRIGDPLMSTIEGTFDECTDHPRWETLQAKRQDREVEKGLTAATLPVERTPAAAREDVLTAVLNIAEDKTSTLSKEERR